MDPLISGVEAADNGDAANCGHWQDGRKGDRDHALNPAKRGTRSTSGQTTCAKEQSGLNGNLVHLVSRVPRAFVNPLDGVDAGRL